MSSEYLAPALVAAGFLVIGVVLGLRPSPEVGFVLQAGGLGGAIGLLIGYRLRRRSEGVDPAVYVARWSLWVMLGAIFGVLIDWVL
jgi:hypothetical protein